MSKKYANPIDFIYPVNINGLDGRFLYLKSKLRTVKSNILIVYDINSNIEKWWGLAIALTKYSNVSIVDLPGFGGMDSLFKIGWEPTIDSLADYLASFIKLRYRNKRFSIIAIGAGFSIATRTLQNNKAIEHKVNNFIAINGYAHHDDLNVSKKTKIAKRFFYRVLATRIISFFIKNFYFNRKILDYRINDKVVKKIRSHHTNQFIKQFMVDLLYENDFRTRIFLRKELLGLNNCDIQLSVPFYQISTGFKQYNLIANHVEQHLKIIFKDYHYLAVRELRKIPYIMNDPKVAIRLIHPKLRRILQKS